MLEGVITYGIACFIVFGLPIVALIVWIKKDELKALLQSREKADADYLATHGKDAYDEMLKKRSAAPSPSAIIGSTTNGIWYGRTDPQRLIKLIELNLPNALIGTPPYRLTEFTCDLKNQLVEISGSWPCPTRPDVTTVLRLQLDLVMQADGRTAVKFKYVPKPADDPFAIQAITLTTHWLKHLCEGAK